MNKIDEFWSWFKENNKAFLFSNSIDENIKEQLLNSFMVQLHKYCDKIYFEIGGFPDETQELIITAEGDKKYFLKVEELINAAPQIDNWIFVAFKPPISGDFKSKWGELELNTEEMYFLPLSNNKTPGIGIRVYLKNHELLKENKTLMTLLYKMLDTILGEKSFASDVDYIDTDLLPDNAQKENMYSILELPEYIQWYKSQKSQESIE
ncbi:hypothetical protein BH10BAC2_BH10BAC2_04930 [soil metagenome]